MPSPCIVPGISGHPLWGGESKAVQCAKPGLHIWAEVVAEKGVARFLQNNTEGDRLNEACKWKDSNSEKPSQETMSKRQQKLFGLDPSPPFHIAMQCNAMHCPHLHLHLHWLYCKCFSEHVNSSSWYNFPWGSITAFRPAPLSLTKTTPIWPPILPLSNLCLGSPRALSLD